MRDFGEEFLALQQALAGRYSLERELGRGGMGIVFLARDVALSRLVAIKLLPAHVAGEPAIRERFLREARTAASLFHPNIVPIHVVEENGALVFFVMAYVDGESLGERVRRAGPMPSGAVRQALHDVAWALSYAHEKGVIHRDIKPDNILLERSSGRALVADFGIARGMETPSSTRGEVLGTVQYMSPEQATGGAIDGRSDLYSLGVTAFFALTGRLPFESKTAAGFIRQHASVPAPRMASVSRAVPTRLAEAIDRCLAKDPAERFATGEALARAAAEAGTKAEAVPPEIRLLLRRIRHFGMTLGYLFYGVTIVFFPVIRGMFPRSQLENYAILLVISLLALSTEISRLVLDARRALRKGYGIAFVRQTLAADVEAMKEERALIFGDQSESSVAQVRAELRPKWPVSRKPLSRDAQVRRGPGAAVAPTLGERLLGGAFGRILFRVAAMRLKNPPPRASVAGERTELVLASAIDELFAQLPREIRGRFSGVRELVGRLDADAVILRAREASLSDALARIQVHVGREGVGEQERLRRELEAERTAVRNRLATAVAAIESIRLDLLRLHAGVGSPDDLTADLERARELGSALDAEIAGRGEVEQLLSRTRAQAEISTSTS